MLILASASPRRQELLRLITTAFQVVTLDTDETVPTAFTPKETVLELARRKALAVSAIRPGDLILGADTVVALDGEILGKPRDENHAAAMLRKLSGRVHQVYTGVALVRDGSCERFCQCAEVEFLSLTEGQIAGYIATGEPMDKAGAYGIQDRGAVFIPGILGDYYTVMGLPVSKLAQILDKYGENGGEL